MDKLTLKSLNEKIANQQEQIDKMSAMLFAMADKMHFGKEDMYKFIKKIRKYGTQEKKS